MNTSEKIEIVCNNMAQFLIAKNVAYGDSALNPVRIFSKADSVEQIKIRIDDKLIRLMQGHEFGRDDTVKDLCGYLILLMVTEMKEEVEK